LYLDLLGSAIAEKTLHPGILGAEEERARLALDLAAQGRSVALVSSGDAGIYGLASLVFELIDRRLEAAAAGDFVIALYNPRSARRHGQLERAREILLAKRSGDTPVALARNLGRSGERVTVTTLSALDPAAADMLTLLVIGNSATRKLDGVDVI